MHFWKKRSELVPSFHIFKRIHACFFKGAARHDYRLRQQNEAKALELLIRSNITYMHATEYIRYLSTLLVTVIDDPGFISIQYNTSSLVNLNDKIIELYI